MPASPRTRTPIRRLFGLAAGATVAVVGLALVAPALDGDDSSSAEPVTVREDESDAPEQASEPPTQAAGDPSPSAETTQRSTTSPPPAPSVHPSPAPAPTATSDGASTPPSSGNAQPSPVPEGGTARGQRAVVERIVDGDTLYLSGLPERARLIGIDTPETVKPNSPVECFGPEASAALANLVPPGTPVRVVFDVERIDRYDRPLVYLYRDSDDLFVNRAMLRRGFAQVATYPPNVAHVDEFLHAQRLARKAGSGLWSTDCDASDPARTDASGSSDGSSGGSSDQGGEGGPSRPGSGDGRVVIATVEWDGPGDDVEHGTSEHVVLHNPSGTTVDVGGWSVTDRKDHSITIPEGYRIPAGGDLRVHTGPGDDTERAYHDGASQAIWNNSGGDTATLRDRNGRVIDEFSYTS